MSPDGHERRDIAVDVLTQEEKKCLVDGKQLPDDAGVIMTTEYLIKRLIDISSYKTRTEQKKADTIYSKVKVENDVILLEDEEYNMIKVLADNCEIFLQGRAFSAFYDAIEEAEEISVSPTDSANE